MRLFSNVWSENTALFERLMEIHFNSPKLYYGFNTEYHSLFVSKTKDYLILTRFKGEASTCIYADWVEMILET